LKANRLQVNDSKNLNSVAIIFAKYHSEFGIDYDFSKKQKRQNDFFLPKNISEGCKKW
jgi:hypothetical protein